MKAVGAFLVFFVASLGFCQVGQTRIDVGDVLSVTILSEGEPQMLSVMPDGTVSGTPFGVVSVLGETMDGAARRIQERCRKYIKDPVVFVRIVQQRERSVFVVGVRGAAAKVPWQKGLDLRSVSGGGDTGESADRIVVRHFRGGKQLGEASLGLLLAGAPGSYNPSLEPDDVVTVSPVAMARIWLNGRFKAPGERLVPVGTTLDQAVALAGGADLAPPTGIVVTDAEFYSLSRIVLMRGGARTEFGLDDHASMAQTKLEGGDTLTVVFPELITVTLAGQVKEPGTLNLLSGSSVAKLIGRGGGLLPDGSLKDVLIVGRNGVRRVDLRGDFEGSAQSGVVLEAGDMVVVQENRASYAVFGTVAKPGRYLIPDDREVRLSDSLAAASGSTVEGSIRRVAVARAGADGQYSVTEYNLDDFLKKGDLAMNPVLQPGDMVLFGKPKGMTMNTLLQLMPTALVFGQLVK